MRRPYIRLAEARLEDLLPTFAPYVRALKRNLQALGYDPCVRSTGRSLAQAAANAATGVGSAKSLHCYGAAADFVCQTHHWDCVAFGCRFYEQLGVEAELLGLVWGGRWTRGGKGPDKPHVQCVPVKEQARFRAVRPERRDAWIRTYLRPLPK